MVVTASALIKGIFGKQSELGDFKAWGNKPPSTFTPGEIKHWAGLRRQVNADTGKPNSYRQIQKIVTAEGMKAPSLGSLRNYLGSGGVQRLNVAQATWRQWFERFGSSVKWIEEGGGWVGSPEQWTEFRKEYSAFMGYE